MPIKLNISLLQDAINRAGIRKQVDSVLVLEKFIKIVEKIFTEEYSKERARGILTDFKPLHFKNKVITVASLNPSLSQELRLRERTILYRLNNEFGKNIVDRILFVV
ncbi:MAG: DciA family protein [bacterium]